MTSQGSAALARFSFNTATAPRWPLPDAVQGCVAAGVPGIGLWREPVAEYGLVRAAKLVRDAGLAVTSLCRGGFFTAADPATRAAALDDNRRAIAEAATLGAPTLVLVSGGLPDGDRDITAARERVADAVAALVPEAQAAGVQLAIEPLHPMFASDRCVISTLGQALDIAENHDPDSVGVVVDAYHVWWDDQVCDQIARAAGRIASFQVCDWVTPLPAGVLLGRGMMGDGHIELRRLREAVDAAGYTGLIEVEIFSDALAARPGAEVLALSVDRYLGHVA